MRLPAKIRGKTVLIRPFSMIQEKEILLLNELCADKDFAVNEVLRILKFHEDNNIELSETERKLVLYKYRSLSVGEICSVNITCEKCNSVTRNTINLDSFETESDNMIDGILNLDYEVTDENLHEFFTYELLEKILSENDVECLDDLDLDVYENLFNDVRNSQSSVNFIKTLKCGNCKTEYKKDFGELSVVLNFMSDDTIRGLYDYTNTLVKFGYTKQDVDALMPFERAVITDLIMESENG